MMKIDPDTVYSEDDLAAGLQLPRGVLARERKDGYLRSAKRGGSFLFLGRWVLEWLEAGNDGPAGEEMPLQLQEQTGEVPANAGA